MWMSVAFPRCPKCRENGNQCFHKDCKKGGHAPLEIDTDTAQVRCPSCERSWYIRSSTYHCKCGKVFPAEEVSDELDAILVNARLIAKELKRQRDTANRIATITDNVIADIAADSIKKGFGQDYWKKFTHLIPGIVAIIKSWFGLGG